MIDYPNHPAKPEPTLWATWIPNRFGTFKTHNTLAAAKGAVTLHRSSRTFAGAALYRLTNNGWGICWYVPPGSTAEHPMYDKKQQPPKDLLSTHVIREDPSLDYPCPVPKSSSSKSRSAQTTPPASSKPSSPTSKRNYSSAQSPPTS